MGDFTSTAASWLQTLVVSSAALAVGLLGILYVYQEKLLYFPSMPGVSRLTTENPEGYRHPNEYGIDYEDVFIPCADGIKIHAWLMKQPQPTTVPTIVFFHGNAGNIGYRLPNAAKMYRHLECNILLVDYRGFGMSDGEPTERGLQLDAEGVVDYLHSRGASSVVDPSKLIVFGRSLGGAVAVYVASTRPTKVAGLIVENTFLSISAMVDQVMPWLSYVKPVVLRLDWSNEGRIPTLTHPILFVAGERDELVPHTHMQKLHALATKSIRRQWLPIPRGTHNDSWMRGGLDYFFALKRFIDSAVGESTPPSSDTANTSERHQEDGASIVSSDEADDGLDHSHIPNMLDQHSLLFQRPGKIHHDEM
ncbi:hypothetical protein, variant 1 [Aphanomyces astaci]|uniref:Serine aminopeptidase S33 domain-containing protein n=1 Tax=Aphanomyces astaci TaxID=112090 RepID=W4H415_APHAT|nr:hypothetical protein H257_02436 [Aphanomyces astaci]XP_009824379.1 hypothetical protein, variant 1 [Aphanomyces astaci]ETV85902.1 hypothetical protein H257_02436 [Aphanomyces astaci]ETV85903.1 hypothetical protein, variant 1 [Aphanomyces astaci]|eukprot:XP_009824374.1 hypothetical protein H257_02436 [Aphanomyces astaci]